MLTERAFVPAKGRPREFDHDDVVERAMHAFWSTGFRGTSLPDLLDATRLSRGSLYSAFGDKHGLFLHALDRYIADSLKRVDSELSTQRSAVAGLRLFLRGYVARNSGAAGRRGCLIVSTAMELTGDDPEVEQHIQGFFRSLETRLTKALQRGLAEGEVRANVDPANAARVLLGMVEGMRVMAKTGLDKHVWQGVVDSHLSLLTQ